MESKKSLDIVKISNSNITVAIDEVTIEKLIDIYVNKEYYTSLTCTPTEKIELAIGFLFAEGIITSIESIKSITELSEELICAILNYDLKDDFRERKVLTSGCAKGSLNIKAFEGSDVVAGESSCMYSANDILSMMREFNQSSELFKQTGGVHSCAICDKDNIIYFSEDIGRHNALDKVIGKALLNKLKLADKLLMTTGRISSDIAIKAARAGIPIIVSHSAPTDMAVDTAKAANITMVGFARGSRMSIYCGSERIII